jgi:hypothetical protein
MSTRTASEEHSLTTALAWLRQQLQAAIAGDSVAPAEKTPPPLPPALRLLSGQLGLSPFEQKTLLLCAAPEFVPEMAGLYAQAQGNPGCAYPTFALALALFDDASWDALSAERPLRYWRLVQVDHAPDRPLVASPLQADERVVNLLKGLNQLDHRLSPFLLPLPTDGQAVGLPPSQQGLVDQALAYLERADAPLIQLVGPDPLSKELVARQIAARRGLQLYSLPAQLIPAGTRELEDFARLWFRESLLLPLALYLDACELEPDAPTGELAQRIRQFLYRSGGLFMLDTRDVWYNLGQANCALDVRKPAPAEQIAAWDAVLPAGAEHLPPHLAAQFNLNLPTIHDITHDVLNQATTGPDGPLPDRLWQACLAYTRPRLDTLAQRIVPRATWDDIVLPADQLRCLRHIADQVGQRSTVYEDWGFRRRSSRGLGISVLFSGESGTGKTMAAEILANHLKLNLYRIDLSAVVSKYIGETEKNLRKLFDAAEDGGAVLFFDEADALFGKRSEVRDSHDRYANIEVSYLLQRLEAYQGLAILATNLKSGLDEAFTRRLRFSVMFPRPDQAHRLQIWRKIFPPETPLAELDNDYLADKFNLSGGSIYNIALNAAFMAAHDGAPVSMPHVLEAIRIELAKEGRLPNEKDFIWKESNP